MLLDVQDVTLRLDDKIILDELNLQVVEGEIHSILGVNGVGKSVLAGLLMGLKNARPEKGRIMYAGEDITSLPISERARRGLTLAWQAPAGFEGLTVRDYLELSARHAKNGGDAGQYNGRIESNLERVGLAPADYLDRFVDERLSGGERRRIELASVVTMRPRLAILDEPDSGIDFLSLEEITDVIRYMSQQGTTILLITHREEMALMATTASLMCAGMVIAAGDPYEVTDFFRHHCDDCKHPNLPDLKELANELQQRV